MTSKCVCGRCRSIKNISLRPVWIGNRRAIWFDIFVNVNMVQLLVHLWLHHCFTLRHLLLLVLLHYICTPFNRNPHRPRRRRRHIEQKNNERVITVENGPFQKTMRIDVIQPNRTRPNAFADRPNGSLPIHSWPCSNRSPPSIIDRRSSMNQRRTFYCPNQINISPIQIDAIRQINNKPSIHFRIWFSRNNSSNCSSRLHSHFHSFSLSLSLSSFIVYRNLNANVI